MAVNRGPSTLAAKIQKCLSADLTSDLVEVICRNLQTMRNRGKLATRSSRLPIPVIV